MRIETRITCHIREDEFYKARQLELTTSDKTDKTVLPSKLTLSPNAALAKSPLHLKNRNVSPTRLTTLWNRYLEDD